MGNVAVPLVWLKVAMVSRVVRKTALLAKRILKKPKVSAANARLGLRLPLASANASELKVALHALPVPQELTSTEVRA